MERVLQGATLCSHPGLSSSKQGGIGPERDALWLASVNKFDTFSEYLEASYYYRRYGSPNVDALGTAVAALEGGESGLATSSGMGAILIALVAICEAGSVVVAPRDPYGGTYDLFVNDFRRFGIEVKFEDVQDLAGLDSTLCEISSATTSTVVVFVETFSNPLIKPADIESLSKLCKKYKCLLVVDNTFATPIKIKPLKQGADIVVHSATKFLGGHNDAMAGVLVGPSKYTKAAAGIIGRWGLAASPFDAWLVLRGIRTLEVRMQRQWETAQILAKKLIAHPAQLKVYSSEGCSLLAIDIPGGFSGVEAAVDAFQIIMLSPSLGGTPTTVSHSASSSHKFLPPQERAALGITDGLLRMSVGLEHVDDIWDDIQRGLAAALTSQTKSQQ